MNALEEQKNRASQRDISSLADKIPISHSITSEVRRREIIRYKLTNIRHMEDSKYCFTFHLVLDRQMGILLYVFSMETFPNLYSGSRVFEF
jgi:hypothetical protein